VSRTGPALYGPQETSIVILDATTLAIAAVRGLRTFGTGTPYLTR
jgi:hypothetical protein